jgi:hypothetical protein
MKTTTRKPERTAKVQKVGNVTVLWLSVGRLTTAYRVSPISSQLGGKAFRLEKADQGDGAAEVYDVLCDGQHSTCDCKGFSRYGMSAANGTGCKHVAGCKAARLRETLFAIDRGPAATTLLGWHWLGHAPQSGVLAQAADHDDLLLLGGTQKGPLGVGAIDHRPEFLEVTGCPRP